MPEAGGMNQELRLIILVGVAFLSGLCVLFMVPGYNVSGNLTSNADYYPGIHPAETSPGSDLWEPDLETPTPVADEEILVDEKPPAGDYEF